MSYCRFGDDSDVYVYHSINEKIVCCMCGLDNDNCGDGNDNEFNTLGEIVVHLQEHQAKGHLVPEHAFEWLKKDFGNGSFK